MPLEDSYPRIDDRRYSDIVAEVRSRIPRYTPEWTDLNENEPGMAVVELFAWMTELLIARLGQVPKLNYLKFLALLGIELTPAQPARAEITFPVRPTYLDDTVIVPLHTQVQTLEPDGEGRSIVFETERALIALTAAMDSVLADNGVSLTDLSVANADAMTGFQPFGFAPGAADALLLGFDSPLAFPSVDIDLMAWVKHRRATASDGVSCGQTRQPPVQLAWEGWDGRDWSPLELLKDESLAFTRSGHLLLKAPAKGMLQRAIKGPVAGPRFWLRARIESGVFQQAPTLLAIRTNTVTATQAETIDNELLKGSDGRPDQVVRLSNGPVLDGTLVLLVDEGSGALPWQEVVDFDASGPDDLHYVLNRTTAEIRFGNGRRGHIPVANPNRRANIIADSYRFGGGLRGNVAAMQIVTLRGALPGVDASLVGNLFPASGGGDEESLKDAQARVPQTLKSHDRAVTLEDYELHARAAGGIARAKALPLFHPEFPGTPVPGVVSVIVVPEPDSPDDPAPMPTEGTLRGVCAYLDDRRLATTELYVIPPLYREIRATAELVCRADADLAEVRQQASMALARYFHPLTGGDEGGSDGEGSGWPFGGDVYYSQVLQRLMVQGVRRVMNLELTLEDDTFPACSDVPLEAHALLRSGAHLIRVRYEEQP